MAWEAEQKESESERNGVDQAIRRVGRKSVDSHRCTCLGCGSGSFLLPPSLSCFHEISEIISQSVCAV